eukprot:9220568-Alexandrium_andersonii.AAC.1
MQLLKGALAIDGRPRGFGGLAVMEPLPTLGLEVGDRVMEEGPVVDIHKFDDVRPPADLTFFRTHGSDGHFNFLSQLFSVIGFSVSTLRLDVTHVLDLGILQWLIGSVFLALLVNNFLDSNMEHADARILVNLIGLRKRMKAYYKQKRRQGVVLSEILKLTLPMLATRDKPRLKAKAAETRHLLPLARQLCVEYPAKLGLRGACLRGACERMCD